MHDERAVAGIDDLTLLIVAVVAFSLFFASLTAAYVRRESLERGNALQGLADSLLDAVLRDPRWTTEPAFFVAERLAAANGTALANVAAGHPFVVVVRNLVTNGSWILASGTPAGDRRVAATSANVQGSHVDPARVSATVWGP